MSKNIKNSVENSVDGRIWGTFWGYRYNPVIHYYFRNSVDSILNSRIKIKSKILNKGNKE